MSHPYTIRPARPGERDAILAVMEPWNMHHVPSEEMAELDLACFFVATEGDRIVGASGYAIIGPGQGKTTLMAVLPECKGTGIGKALQDVRLEAMAANGVHTVTTNADRPKTIDWYKRLYGYREVGTLPKLHSFGLDDVDHWTTLELDLAAMLAQRANDAR